MRQVEPEVKELEAELAEVEAKRDELAVEDPKPSRARGSRRLTEEDAVVLREVGERPQFEFEIRDHLDLGRANGWIEMEKAGEASGSRFAYLLGDLVLVELALVRFASSCSAARGSFRWSRRYSSARARFTAPASSPASGR